ncbi:hypothetical protein ACHQM5_023474 [Ranunculus cassubicifolius]
MSTPNEISTTFRALIESADRKFIRVRDIPLYTRVPHHYFHKVFKAYTKLWKFQQENRLKLVESGLQRWEIGEIASRIGQLYYGQYMRTSETRFLLEAYVFYEAIFSRGYFEKPKVIVKDLLSLRFKELRFYARFLVVALVLNRSEMVKLLVERFRLFVDECKATFRETNLREWKVVVQEILRFLKVDTAYKNTRPLRYCTILDSYPASLPYVARFHAKKVLKLRDTLLVSYHRNEVRFTELTLNNFRMLQCLEWEPSGSFFQMQTTETNNNGVLNDQSGASGLIDINLAMDMTDPTLPPNPRKAILHRPSATHLISVIHGSERGETAAMLLSPQRPSFLNPTGTDPTNTAASQFTFFLTSPLQAFCQLVSLSASEITDKDTLDKAESILSTAFSEWEVKLCTLTGLDLVWAQVLSDPFLRRLILRFIFCRSVLSLFCSLEDCDQYVPICLPPLPDYVSTTSEVVQHNVQLLATSLGVADYFHFDASLHPKKKTLK